ncbi:hypothetical protein DFS33DRAFT_1307712 [Desarmillaria ectypa]|nr:hypothetical protein DFS33DRAFT_1307712 [Desarmillaria ectypa]
MPCLYILIHVYICARQTIGSIAVSHVLKRTFTSTFSLKRWDDALFQLALFILALYTFPMSPTNPISFNRILISFDPAELHAFAYRGKCASRLQLHRLDSPTAQSLPNPYKTITNFLMGFGIFLTSDCHCRSFRRSVGFHLHPNMCILLTEFTMLDL